MSGDIFLGAPYNIAFYALLTEILAQQTGLEAGELIISIGDAHLYLNHIEQAKEMLKRDPFPLPVLIIKRKPESIFDYNVDDFDVFNYKTHPAIKAPVAV